MNIVAHILNINVGHWQYYDGHFSYYIISTADRCSKKRCLQRFQSSHFSSGAGAFLLLFWSIYNKTSSKPSKMRYLKIAKLQHVKLKNLTLTYSHAENGMQIMSKFGHL